MPTDKNAMALYVKVVESGSFSKAAVREGVPVSTVSRKIADPTSATQPFRSVHAPGRSRPRTGVA